MATASCSSRESTSSLRTNYARFGHAIQFELPNILRELLLIKEPTNLLEGHVRNNNVLKKNLRQREWNIIKNVGSNLYQDFDLSLMYKIIRNLHSIVQSPTKGWGNPTAPLVSEITIGDDIERIIRIRNEFAHRGNTKVTNSELANNFALFKKIAMRFEAFLMKSNREFVSQIELIERCCMDIKTKQKYIKELKDAAAKENRRFMEVNTKIDCIQLTLTGNISKLQKKINNIRREQMQGIPKNIREQMKKKIEKWMEDEKTFVPTKASKYVLTRLNNTNCVTVVGSQGAGKTAITRHAALQMEKKGYSIIPITFPTDIRNYYQPGKQSIFVIDDIGGNCIANQQMIDSWEQLLDVVEQILLDNCKIVLSCRLQVYKDKKFNVLVPFKSCECNVVSTFLRLSQLERKKIAKAYLGNYDYEIVKKLNYDCFPLLCFLCSKQDNIDINEFFRLTFKLLETQLNSLWDKGEVGQLKFCALALCVIYDNDLLEKYLTSNEYGVCDVLNDVYEACGLNRGTSIVRIKEEIDTLVGSYLKKVNGVYTAIHDTVFDFLVDYCNKRIPDCLIKHGISSFIRERFLWTKLPHKPDNGFIILTADNRLTLYLDRLVSEWSNGKISDVFLENMNMESTSFRCRLVAHLRNLDQAKQSNLAGMTMNFGDLLFSCLEICCYKGYTNFLKWILDQGVDINQCVSGATPLSFACVENKTEMINRLLKTGADVNRSGISGMTPLHAICNKDEIDVAVLKALLKHKAGLDNQMFDGSTPLLFASCEQDSEAVEILLRHSADINIGFYNSKTIKSGFKKMYSNLSDEEEDIFWDLITDCLPSSVVVPVKQFTNYIIDFVGGATPLHLMCIVKNIKITRMLLDQNPKINKRKEDGSTPLFTACEFGCIGIAKILLEHGANRTLRRYDKKSPLDIARQNHYPNIVSLLNRPKRKSMRIANRNKNKRMKYS